MTTLTTDIQKQIKNCKHLLAVFIGERQYYLEQDTIQIKDVMSIMSRKMTLVENLKITKSVIDRSNQQSGAGARSDDTRVLIRELSELLEQLLVIENENERLLTRLLGKAAGGESGPPGVPPSRLNVPVNNPAVRTGHNRGGRHADRKALMQLSGQILNDRS